MSKRTRPSSLIDTISSIEQFWRSNPALRPDLRPSFGRIENKVKGFLDKQDSPEGVTQNAQDEFNLALAQLDELCRDLLFGVPFGDIHECVRRGEKPENYLSPIFTDTAPIDNRKAYYEERNRLIAIRDGFRRDLENYTSATKAARSKEPTANYFLLRSLEQVQNSLDKLRTEEPPAWFDASRIVEPLTDIVTDQVIKVRITLRNRGRNQSKLSYYENMPDGVEILRANGWTITESGLHCEALVSAGKDIQVEYSFCVRKLGVIVLIGNLEYEQRTEGWDLLSNSVIVCENEAKEPDLFLERFYRYLPAHDTEILLRLSNKKNCRIARNVVFNEIYRLGGSTYHPSVNYESDMVLPGEEPTWASYIIRGRHEVRDIEFDPDCNATFLDDAQPKYITAPSECRLLKYRGLYGDGITVGLDDHLQSLKETVQSVQELGSTHLLSLYGPSGTGKTRLLRDLHALCTSNGFNVVEMRSRRNSNFIATLLRNLMNLQDGPELPEDIDRFLSLMLPGQSRERFGAAIKDYVLMKSPSIDTSLVAKGIALILGALTNSEFAQTSTDSVPLLIVVDDGHEIRSRIEKDIFNEIVIELTLGKLPILLAVAETTNADQIPTNASLMDESSLNKSFTRLETRILTESETVTLVDTLIDYPKLSKGIQDFVVQVSKGVPQYVIDILQWLTESENLQVKLSGDLWTKEIWGERDRIGFGETLTFLSVLARDQLNSLRNAFEYLRVLSVVGEVVPIQLARLLHQEIFANESDSNINAKIEAFRAINFLRFTPNRDLEFSHLSRWHAIYHDKTFGGNEKRAIQERIVECIVANSEIYTDPQEISSQIAHHLAKSAEEVQVKYVDYLFKAVEREYNRRNNYLTRLYGEIAIRIFTARRDSRVISIFLWLASHEIELKRDYSSAQRYLELAQENLNVLYSGSSDEKSRAIQVALIEKLRAGIYLRYAGTKAATAASDYARNAVQQFEKHHPRRIPFFSKPIQNFPYTDLLEAYLLYAEALIKLNRERVAAGENSIYGYTYTANEEMKKARRLINWLSRKSEADMVAIIQMEFSLAETYLRQANVHKAKESYQHLSDLLKRRATVRRGWTLVRKIRNHETALSGTSNLWFHRGRVLQRLAKLRLEEKNEQTPQAIMSSISDFESALELHNKVGDTLAATETHRALGNLYLGTNKSHALSHFESGIRLAREWGYTDEWWKCCCSALELLIERGELHSCKAFWDQAYDLFLRFSQANDETIIDRSTMDALLKAARTLGIHFETEGDLGRQLQTVELQLAGDHDTGLEDAYKLLSQKGKVQTRLNEYTLALGTFLECLKIAKQNKLGDEYILDARVSLAEVYETVGFTGQMLIEDDVHSSWEYYEPEFHLEQVCLAHARRGEEAKFIDVYRRLVQLVSSDPNKLRRFPKSYFYIFRNFKGENVFAFVDLSLNLLIEKSLFVDAGDLLIYSVILRLAIQGIGDVQQRYYLRRAEDLYLFERAASVSQLQTLFLGFGLLNDLDGFGRSFLWIFEELIDDNDLEGIEILFERLSTLTYLRRIPAKYLVVIRNRLEALISSLHSFETDETTKLLKYLWELQQALGEKYNSDLEITRALRVIGTTLRLQRQPESILYNHIGLSFSSLKEHRKAAVIYQYDAQTNYGMQSRGMNTAVAFGNLASGYLEIELDSYALPLLIAAYEDACHGCREYDKSVFPLDLVSESSMELVSGLFSYRKKLIWIAGLLAQQIGKTTPGSDFAKELRVEINHLTDQLEGKAPFQPLPKMPEPPFNLEQKDFTQALNLRIENAPSKEAIIEEIRNL